MSKSESTKIIEAQERIKVEQEEELFRQTINSWGIKDVYLNNIFEECKDGILLSRVLETINDKVVDWSKIKLNPKSDFDLNINNNSMI